jgi:hypothetical protein
MKGIFPFANILLFGIGDFGGKIGICGHGEPLACIEGTFYKAGSK